MNIIILPNLYVNNMSLFGCIGYLAVCDCMCNQACGCSLTTTFLIISAMVYFSLLGVSIWAWVVKDTIWACAILIGFGALYIILFSMIYIGNKCDKKETYDISAV
jgi:ABC-type anion transport system duplicated permease subunit